MNEETVLRVEHAVKRFTGVTAVNDFNLELHKHEIVAIMGENGAGKSTICKMLTGVHPFDEGKMFLEGKEMHFASAKESMLAGIGMVYQERNLIGMLTGAQNIVLGFEPVNGKFISEKEALEKATKLRDSLGLSVPLDIPVEELGAGEQQLIEIIRAFYQNPRVLILDEPTSSIGRGEVEPFLQFVKDTAKNTDISIIFISHKLEETYLIADTIVVMTDGRQILTKPKEELPKNECIAAMLRSKKSTDPIEVPVKDFSKKEVILESRKAYYDGRDHELDITVREGEVVGFYGLVGSGRTEFAETLFGLRPAKNREVKYLGEPLEKETPVKMIEKGLVLTPEIRARGIFPSLSIVDNICNMFLKTKLSGKSTFVMKDKSIEFADEVLKNNDVKYKDRSDLITSLSGGNMQKVIMGRSIAMDHLRLLIADEPTTGMDIGAKFDIYRRIRSLADSEGSKAGVIFISSELEELLQVADRIYVFGSGDAIQCFDRNEFDNAKILEVAVRGKKV